MTRSEWNPPDIDTFDNDELSVYERRQLQAQPPPMRRPKRIEEREPQIVRLEDVKR